MILQHQDKYQGTWPTVSARRGRGFAISARDPEKVRTYSQAATAQLTPYERARNAQILAEIAERDEQVGV